MQIGNIGTIRLRQQGILSPSSSIIDAVSSLGAMQSQDYAGGLWSVGLRTGATLQQVEQAIVDKQIVRTWPMRGTLHFMAAKDVHWMLDLLAPRIIASTTTRRNNLGHSDESVLKIHDLFRSELAGGKIKTRAEMLGILNNNGYETSGQRGYHLLLNASLNQVLCFGPVKGKEQTFVLLDEWLPNPVRKERDESLKELAIRYFTSHGPATLQDFIGWAYITVKDAKRGIELAGETLKEQKIGDKTYLLKSETIELAQSGAFILPGFDEYILGYKNRSDVLEPNFTPLICPGNNGVFMPTIVINGQVVGTWKQTKGKNTRKIELKPFTKFSDANLSQINKAVQQYGAFLGEEITVV